MINEMIGCVKLRNCFGIQRQDSKFQINMMIIDIFWLLIAKDFAD